MLWPAYGRGGICWDHLADNERVEQHPHGGELLLDRRSRGLRLELLYIGGDVVRPDRGEREATLLTPREKLSACPGIRSAGVRIADVGGKEFHIAPAGLVAEVGDQRRH
jgi:hypothetical protein